jgi:hypothetical protein
MAWQGNGMGAAWERHGMCELAFTRPSNRYWPYCSRAWKQEFCTNMLPRWDQVSV